MRYLHHTGHTKAVKTQLIKQQSMLLRIRLKSMSVVSRSFLNGDVVEEINKLKQQDGPELQVHGSGNLIQTLLEHDLVEEFWLKIFPITLGMGKRLFDKGTIPAAFTLVESKTSPTGVIVASFKRAGKVKIGSF